MQGFHLKKIALGLLVLGLLDLSTSQTVDTESTSNNHKWMIGTKASESEIIPIHKSEIQKRSINGRYHLQLRAFGEHIKLWLEPNEGVLATSITPVFRIDGTGEIVQYSDFMNKMAGILYTDEQKAATMFITKDANGNYQVNGVIGGKGLAIRPTSNPFETNNIIDTNNMWYVSERFKRFIEDTPVHERGNYSYHIVSKIPPVSEHLKSLKPPTLNFPRSKRALAPQVVYPEIMVIVDYSLFKHFRKNRFDVVKYVLSFWNSVDFIYRSLENPKYRLNIAGIVIAETSSALPFMNNRLRYQPYDLRIDNALDASAEFILKLEEQLQKTYSFDAAITMTSTPVCAGKEICKRGTIGLAYVGGACHLPQLSWSNGKLVPINGFKSSIVYDQAGYDGVNVAAHELGHLLGAGHDGEDHKLCDDNIGNLMAPTISFTSNSSDWSLCSVKDMENYLNSRSSECLFNKPDSRGKLSRFLPGKMMNAHEQCVARGFQKAVEINDDMCVNLRCLHKSGRFIEKLPGAVDGSVCGVNKICLHRQCIDISTFTY